MAAVRTFNLSPDFRIEVGPPRNLTAHLVSSVDEIWAAEKKERGDHLTDGVIFELAEFDPDRLLIMPSQYRFVLARRRKPELETHGVAIRPLAVTGILTCADGVVLGRRGPRVASDAGLWEPAVAGGMSQENPISQVFEELEEELGLSAADIVSHNVCGLVEDVASGVFDIVFRLQTALSGKEIRTAFTLRGSDEYDDLAIVELPLLSAFIEDNKDDLIPALRPMLQLAGLL